VSLPARRARLFPLVVLTLALAAPSSALARDAELGPPAVPWRPSAGPASSPPGSPSSRLIVRYRSGTGAAERARIRAAEQLDRLANLPSIDAEVVRPRGRSGTAALAALRSRSDVELVVPDQRRTIFIDPTAEEAWSAQWGHHNTGQPVQGVTGRADADVDALEALAITPGSGSVVVAVIDDGVDFSHPDLSGRAWTNPLELANGLDDDGNGYVDDVNGWDFCNGDNSVHDFDQDWHGTAVAGTIAASLDGRGTVGVAPATTIMALKFLKNPEDDPAGACGWDSQAIEAIAYASRFGVRLMNASWGGPSGEPMLETAIERSGALFVTAAGNDAANIDAIPSYPAAYDSANIVAVAATDNRGALAPFSNRGVVGVDIAAPGKDIFAPCPADATSRSPGWCWVDGTSFAAPYVTGVAALVGAVRPALLATPTTLRGRLLGSAVPVAGLQATVAGGRQLNARRALDFNPPAAMSAPRSSPIAPSGLGSTTVAARLSWPAGRDDFGMGTYRVEQRRNGGSWQTLTTGTAALSRDVVVSLSGSYEFRVQPRDAAGNLGPPSTVLRILPIRIEESGTGVVYGGTWRTASTTTASGGATRYTSSTGASVSLAFTGRAVAVVLATGPASGSLKVYVDGRYVRTVGLYSSTPKGRRVLVAQSWSTAASHTIKLVNAPYNGRTRADLDAFVVFR